MKCLIKNKNRQGGKEEKTRRNNVQKTVTNMIDANLKISIINVIVNV